MQFRSVNGRCGASCPFLPLKIWNLYCNLLAEGILKILALYKKLGTHAFNMAIVFDKKNEDHGFTAFCSIISRINPNPLSTSDSAFMERLHLEPVILTLPEELGRYYQNEYS